MSKTEPENRADLYRMLKTSNGWFDGQIREGADVDEIQGWADRQWEEEA